MKYIIHWIGGKTQTVEGDSITDAFTHAGLGAGAVRTVDYYESADKTPLILIPADVLHPIDKLVLVYRSLGGQLYEQQACDLTDVGTLIDPDSGEDLELVGWKTVD